MGGILGCRVSERRGRWSASFQFDTDWVDGERSDKAASLARAKARKVAEAEAVPHGVPTPDPTVEIEMLHARPVRLPQRHPCPGTVGAVDVGIVDAAVVTNGDGTPTRHAGPRPSRPDQAAAVRLLIGRRQRRLARSVAQAKLAAAIAARTVPGPPTRVDVHRTKVRFSRRQERRSRSVSRLVWDEADRRDDLLHKASTAVARSAEVIVTETLHLAGLLRNHRIARSLSEAALGRLVGMVRYKAEKLGGLALGAPRFFPSSKQALRMLRGSERRPRARRAVVDVPDLRCVPRPGWQRRGQPAPARAGGDGRRSRPGDAPSLGAVDRGRARVRRRLVRGP